MLLDALAELGRNPATGGYDRFSFGRVDLALREWFVDRAATLGLEVETDRNGNQWAWWRSGSRAPAFVCGSHLDSVPSGGPWDGPLGVAGALAAVEALQARDVRPQRDVAVVNFAEEEGARFGVACLGSRLLTGATAPERALALRDSDGTTLAEAIAAAGLDPARVGADPERTARIGEFVELHIEQGHLPVGAGAHHGSDGLAAAGRPLGLASEIWPHGRWRLDFLGVANHAGTTRLSDRVDPVLAMARGIQEVRAAADELGILATVGKVEVRPGAVNAIAASASAWVDARGADADSVRRLIARVEERLGVNAVEESWTAVTPFDRTLTGELADLLGDAPVLPSGAGHDAGVLALAGIPVSMVFVRNPSGVSHSPQEHADESDALAGVDALAAIIEARAS